MSAVVIKCPPELRDGVKTAPFFLPSPLAPLGHFYVLMLAYTAPKRAVYRHPQRRVRSDVFLADIAVGVIRQIKPA
jgi:hypothetical protein